MLYSHSESVWHGVRVIDCSNEQCAVRPVSPGPLLWEAADLSREHYLVELPEKALDEIDRVAAYIERCPVQLYQRSESEVNWPLVREYMQRLKSRVNDGPGFAVLQGFDPDRYSDDVNVEIFWLLGQCMGKNVAQKWNGEMIYGVRDTGKTHDFGVRGSHTAVELVFHVDNAFGVAVPDYVGLMCVRPAKSGGISRFCSLYALHERIKEADPDALQRLYQPMLFNRQQEHHEGAPLVNLAPFFSWRDDKLFSRANASLVRSGYELSGIDMDPALEKALLSIESICADNELWFEAPLQRGHVQYLNNHEVGHYRSAFEDYEDPALKRHLYRIWNREQGPINYDAVTS